MSKLKAFMKEAPTGKTKEIFISERFQDDDGKQVPFIVKAITQDENEAIANRCRVDGNLDNVKYTRNMIVECTVEPNFKDAELCQFFGVVAPTDVPSQMLTIGEYAELSRAVLDVNDLGKAYNEALKAAKNS